MLSAVAASALLGFGAMGAAEAQIIDFETLPGGGTPTDNQALTGGYTTGGTTVNFGFDIDGDLIADLDAIIESRNDDLSTGAGYTSSGIPERDLSPTGEGGDFLLRAPSSLDVFTNADFLVSYSDDAVRSVSGQIWDIDYGERYLIEALNTSGGLIDSFLTPATPDREGVGTFDGLPYDFTFVDLAEDIAFVRITGSERIRGGGFAFDNFDATGATVEPPTEVPEPASVAALTLFGLGLLTARKQKSSSV
ncbi:MAG: PEP-CTERM sorting domain-containing protein [Cyanobacteria bacterium P01_G01_bin.54]